MLSLPTHSSLQHTVYLFGMEVMVVLSIHVSVLDTDCGSPLAVGEAGHTVVPQANRDLLVREPSQDQSLARDLSMQKNKHSRSDQ